MRRALLASLLLLAAAPAEAQLARRLGDPASSRRERAESAPAASLGLGRRLDPRPGARRPRRGPEAPRSGRGPGPQIQLGYAFYRVSDGYGGGDVHAATVGVFLQLPLPELRVGLLGEVGSHDYSLGGDDLIARGGLELGVQLLGLLDPFVPHVVALASVGGIVGTRFETTVAHAFGGGGLGLGGELRLHRNLHAGFQVSYQRLEMDGAGFDVFHLRLFLGL
ncbi:MAG: hypothetical protein M5U28_33825 [Sandaracinaceae bacterium]|nr:hypothetical protein [Sandaracinaceae bacterium]